MSKETSQTKVEKNYRTKEALQLWFYGLRLWKRHAPKMFRYFLVFAFFSAITPYVFLFFQARIVDEIAGLNRATPLMRLAIIAVVCIALFHIAQAISKRLFFQYESRYFSMMSMFSDSFLQMDYEEIDNPKNLETYNKIQQLQGWAGLGIVAVWDEFEGTLPTIISIITAVSMTLSLFFSYKLSSSDTIPENQLWLTSPTVSILIFLFFVALTYLAPKVASKGSEIWYKMGEEATQGNRIFSWLFQTTRTKQAMEMRIYNQGDFIRSEVAKDDVFLPGGIMDKASRGRIGVLYVISICLSYLSFMLIYSYIGTLAYYGIIGIGMLTQYIGVFTQLSTSLENFFRTLGEIKAQAHVLDMTKSIVDKGDEAEKNALLTNTAHEVPLNLSAGIRIEVDQLSFRYPGSDRDVLNNISFTIEPKERLAIVGRNGSGKTTFIKLLCRLYTPDAGEIRVNGRNIQEYPIETYRKILSVVFQDSKLFAYSLHDNVAVGNHVDEEKIHESLKKAGLDIKKAKQFKNGLDTSLYKELDKDGVEISGGEAQKIAIARALYKDSPLIILDEPTAALDPLAEHDLYTHLNRVIEDKTAIFISHRLSSCTFSDRIAVFHEGELVQIGRHQDLLREPAGIYSELWNAQAQYYQ